MFKRRLCDNPHADGAMTSGANGCPDVWELDNGDVAVIGLRKTSLLSSKLPSDAGCGPDEEIVVVPGDLFRSIRF